MLRLPRPTEPKRNPSKKENNLLAWVRGAAVATRQIEALHANAIMCGCAFRIECYRERMLGTLPALCPRWFAVRSEFRASDVCPWCCGAWSGRASGSSDVHSRRWLSKRWHSRRDNTRPRPPKPWHCLSSAPMQLHWRAHFCDAHRKQCEMVIVICSHAVYLGICAVHICRAHLSERN